MGVMQSSGGLQYVHIYVNICIYVYICNHINNAPSQLSQNIFVATHAFGHTNVCMYKMTNRLCMRSNKNPSQNKPFD